MLFWPSSAQISIWFPLPFNFLFPLLIWDNFLPLSKKTKVLLKQMEYIIINFILLLYLPCPGDVFFIYVCSWFIFIQSWGWICHFLFVFLSWLTHPGPLKCWHSEYFKVIKAGDKNTSCRNVSLIFLIISEDSDADIVFIDVLILKYATLLLLLQLSHDHLNCLFHFVFSSLTKHFNFALRTSGRSFFPPIWQLAVKQHALWLNL